MPSFVVRICLLLCAVQPLSALANTLCCEANGETYCDYGLPAACYGKPYRELNNNGIVIKQYAAPLTAEQRAKLAADRERQRIEDEKRAAQDSEDRKLLSTYATLSDLDDGHAEVLSDLKAGQQQMEKSLAIAEKKKQQLANEAEFYKNHKMPAALKAQLNDNQQEIGNQKKAIDARQQDIAAAKQRFDTERERYLLLTAGSAERRR